MDFREADRQYAELKRRHDAGEIGDEQFDEQRKRLMVRDGEGHWWSKSRETGEWHYRDQSDWVRGMPPAYQQIRFEHPPQQAGQEPAERPRNEAPTRGGAEEHREGDRIRWGRILKYVAIFFGATFAAGLFGRFFGDMARIALGSKAQGEILSNQVLVLAVGVASVIVFGVLTYRTRERAIAHVLLVALITWLISFPLNVLLFGLPVAAWAVSGVVTAVYAFIGLGLGIGLWALRARLASQARETAVLGQDLDREERAGRGGNGGDEDGSNRTNFAERETDFLESDRQYAELKRQREAGEIGDEQFDEQRKRLMVRDGEGHWWSKSRETGEWHYYDGNAWVRDTPPDDLPPSPTVPTESMQDYQPQPEQTEPYPSGSEVSDERSLHPQPVQGEQPSQTSPPADPSNQDEDREQWWRRGTLRWVVAGGGGFRGAGSRPRR